MSSNLTKKQVELLNFIEVFIAESGCSPTYREIARGMGYRSVATVAKHIDNLVAIGRLEKADNGEARSISIKKQIEDLTVEEKTVYDFLIKKKNILKERGLEDSSGIIDKAINIIWG